MSINVSSANTLAKVEAQLSEELSAVQALRRKYPYLGHESESVGSEITDKLEALSKFNDLANYKGPSCNLINKDTDTIDVAEAKLIAQKQWVTDHENMSVSDITEDSVTVAWKTSEDVSAGYSHYSDF